MEVFIKKYGATIAVLYCVLGFIPTLFFYTEKNAGIYIIGYLSVLVVPSYLYLLIFRLSGFKSNHGRFVVFFYSTAICFFGLLFSYGYILSINALFLNHTNITIKGKISALDRAHGKYTEYFVTVNEDNLKRLVTLEISGKEYCSLKTGSAYSEEWKMGSLGIIYREK